MLAVDNRTVVQNHDNRTVVQTTQYNVQQYVGVDGVALMQSVTAYAEQAEAATRERVDQATRQTASMVISEAEARHSAASMEVHNHYEKAMSANEHEG